MLSGEGGPSMAGSSRFSKAPASCRPEPDGVGGGGGDARGDTVADEGALLEAFRRADFGGTWCTGNDGDAKYMASSRFLHWPRCRW